MELAKPSEAPLVNLGDARSLAKPSETRSGEANLGEAKPSEAPLVGLGEATQSSEAIRDSERGGARRGAARSW